MNDNDKKRHELNAEQRTYREYLDRRIPELQAEGKPDRLPASDERSRIAEARDRTSASKFPGRVAREVADAEYARGAR